jgi:hypothetical protein
MNADNGSNWHDKVACAVRFLHRENRDDVRMIECRDGSSFAAKARQALGIARHRSGQQLQRHVAPEFRVGGAVDLAHPPCADFGSDAVVRNRALWGHRGEIRDDITLEPANRQLRTTI